MVSTSFRGGAARQSRKNAASHYIVAIAELRRRFGYVRVTDLAKHLDLTRGTVSITLKSLERKGLVARDANGFLLLTPTGTALAESTDAKNQRLLYLLADLLGVPSAAAERDSHQVGHLISPETAHQICALTRFIDSGHPIVHEFLGEFRRFGERPSSGDGCGSCPNGCRFESGAAEDFDPDAGGPRSD
jgi:Mn-dependent DtxR family transcriptional regulator